MTAPILTAQIQGQGTVSADQLNTYVQWCVNVTQLRAFIGLPNMTVFIEGYNTSGDGGAGTFYWNDTSIGPDNGTTVIVPQPGVPGAWIRITSSYANGPASSIAGDLVSFADTTGKNLADSGISSTGGAFTEASTLHQFQNLGAKINRLNDRILLGDQATLNDANEDNLSTDWLTVFQTSADGIGFADWNIFVILCFEHK